MKKLRKIFKCVVDLFYDKKSKRIINIFLIILSLVSYYLYIITFNIGYGNLKNYFIFIIVPILVLIITNILETSKREKKNNNILILIIYLIFLGSLIIANSVGKQGLYLNGIRYYNYNLVLFDSLKNMITDFLNYKEIIIYNLLMLLPLAIILPLINKKFKNTYLFTLTTILIGFLYEGIEYIFLIGVFDIDVIILRTIGALITFLLIYKTKLIEIINAKLKSIKPNIKVLNNIYIFLFFFLVLISSNCIFQVIDESLPKNNASVSGTYKCDNKEELVAINDNYRYYTKCHGEYSVFYKNNLITLEEFIRITPDITKYLDKFKLRREKVITDIQVTEDNSLKKLIKNDGAKKIYYYNIESIKVRVDDNIYKYEDYLKTYEPKELDLYFTRKEFFNSNKYHYKFYTSDYFNYLICDNLEYYLPKNYKITNNTCDYLKNK